MGKLCYNADMETTLEQLLAARDARAAYIKRLLARFPRACIVVFTVVTPGSVKRTEGTIRLFHAGISAIGKMLQRNELSPLLFESHEKDTGDEAYLAVKTEPGFLKLELCKIEESAPYGRLWDMDVVKPNGNRINREDIGFSERGCFVCGKIGRGCYSQRIHPPEEVRAAYLAMLSSLPE